MVPNRRKIPNKTEAKSAVSQQCSGIRCPECKGPTHVKNGKPKKGDNVHGRYRKCDICETTFYTEEKVVHVINVPDKDA